MIMCIQNLVKFFQFVLKIFSGNENDDGITEQQKDRQGKSSIDPTFSKRGFNNEEEIKLISLLKSFSVR